MKLIHDKNKFKVTWSRIFVLFLFLLFVMSVTSVVINILIRADIYFY